MSDAIVHVVDDEAEVCNAIAMLLRSVGLQSRTYGSAQAFMEGYRPGAPGCIVLDVRLPGMSGLELQDRLQRSGITLPVIVMTGHGDIQMAVRAMRAGALDFVEKPFNDQTLLDRVHEGIARSMQSRDADGERAQVQSRYESLSEREREILRHVVDGRPNKLIADDLGLSTRTVESHRAHIIEKMQATSLSHLVRMAVSVLPDASVLPKRSRSSH